MIEIVIIRIIAAVLFLIAFIISSKVSLKIKKTSDIWLLISASLLIACAESVANALQWAGIFTEIMDIFGEYLIIVFLLDWIYIGFSFISESKEKV